MDLETYLTTRVGQVDAALDRFLPSAKARPRSIHSAMRYSVFSGGKRLRPVLCLAAAEACGGNPENALPPACAVELMHTYSLVHDDLPSMDNDDLRRGRPTCHVVFGEGMAVLCGDALLTEAFAVIASTSPTPRYDTTAFIRELAAAGGSRKLIGGQVMDLEGENRNFGKSALVQIHQAKTAALLSTSMRLGAMSANATPAKLHALTDFGYHLGLAFQVIDDILDITQTTQTLGKTAGKDQAVRKSTYPALLGLEGARKEATKLTKKAMAALQPLGKKNARLQEIAHNLLTRQF